MNKMVNFFFFVDISCASTILYELHRISKINNGFLIFLLINSYMYLPATEGPQIRLVDKPDVLAMSRDRAE
jgi:hypothetical protein